MYIEKKSIQSFLQTRTHTREKNHYCFKTISVSFAIWTGVKKRATETWGQIGTQGATINQLYQSLMESSQWQNGNYSTGCVMLTWHLFCHWLCPCEERNIDQWEKKDENNSGTGNCLLVTSCIYIYILQYNDTNIFLTHAPMCGIYVTKTWYFSRWMLRLTC